jgi:tRNA threonylcarbamoyladenosine biosynthesis protein TsaE
MHPEAQGNIFHHAGQEDLADIAKELIEMTGDCKIWVFRGEMGAGKTTLIKAVGHLLHVQDTMSSPTFSIVNEYTAARGKVFHFDFYRIRDEGEALDIGIDEYFYSGHYCLIEWAEKIPSLIPEEYVEIILTIENNIHRTIAISVHGRQEEKWI